MPTDSAAEFGSVSQPLSDNATLNGDNVLIQRRPRAEGIARAADILEATMRDIDKDKGDVSAESWGSLLRD